MKRNSLFLLLIFLPISGFCSDTIQKRNSRLSVITWNIRMNTPNDGVNAWPLRKDKVAAFLKETGPQIFCLQEVLLEQLNDLAQALPQYAWFGVGRDDGKQAGEYVPVFYQRKRFHYLRGDHFWLSETPAVPGKLGWDAACARMVSWIKLLDRTTGDTLCVFNTHFDHVGSKARLMSAGLLAQAADSIAGNHPIIITGDFNATDKDTPHEVFTRAGYKDSRAVSLTPPAGPVFTFTGFAVAGTPGNRIDYIYLKNTKPVQTYLVDDDSSNGFYLSDHLPVHITFRNR